MDATLERTRAIRQFFYVPVTSLLNRSVNSVKRDHQHPEQKLLRDGSGLPFTHLCWLSVQSSPLALATRQQKGQETPPAAHLLQEVSSVLLPEFQGDFSPAFLLCESLWE